MGQHLIARAGIESPKQARIRSALDGERHARTLAIHLVGDACVAGHAAGASFARDDGTGPLTRGPILEMKLDLRNRFIADVRQIVAIRHACGALRAIFVLHVFRSPFAILVVPIFDLDDLDLLARAVLIDVLELHVLAQAVGTSRGGRSHERAECGNGQHGEGGESCFPIE